MSPVRRCSSITEAPLATLVQLWLLIGANFYFGLDTKLTAGVARCAAMLRLGMAP